MEEMSSKARTLLENASQSCAPVSSERPTLFFFLKRKTGPTGALPTIRPLKKRRKKEIGLRCPCK